MTKHTDDKKVKTESKKDEVVNQPANAIVAPTFADNLSAGSIPPHRYQANSPAVNTNSVAGYPDETKSILDTIQTPEKEKADKEAAKQLEKQQLVAEKQREAIANRYAVPVGAVDRTTLDVSNPLYKNPSLDHK